MVYVDEARLGPGGGRLCKQRTARQHLRRPQGASVVRNSRLDGPYALGCELWVCSSSLAKTRPSWHAMSSSPTNHSNLRLLNRVAAQSPHSTDSGGPSSSIP